MSDFELDHVFLCAPSGRADVEALGSFALAPIERIHPGQGTANACFFFENAYLEILWRHDDRELTSAVVQPTGLWERVRWKETGACPFGIAVRPKQSEIAVEARWEYPAPFLPPGATIPILSPPGALLEPIVFVTLVPAWLTLVAGDQRLRRTLTGVHLWLRTGQVPSYLEDLASAGVTAETSAEEYRMELEWDGGSQGERKDFRPLLPLSLRW